MKRRKREEEREGVGREIYLLVYCVQVRAVVQDFIFSTPSQDQVFDVKVDTIAFKSRDSEIVLRSGNC